MELSKKQQIVMLKSVDVKNVEAFLKDKKFVYANDDTLFYENENKNIVAVLKITRSLEVYGKGKTFIYSKGETVIKGYGYTEVNGDGNTVIKGDGYTEVNGEGNTIINNDGYTEVNGDGNTEVNGDGRTIVAKRNKE